jgi:hypothetical protein
VASHRHQASSAWWSYDLGSGVTKKLASWTQYWDGSSSSIKTATIKASNAGTFTGEEVTIASVDFIMGSGSGFYTATFAPPATAYRYYRLFSSTTINTTNGNRPISFEFQASESPVPGNLTLVTTAQTADSSVSNVRVLIEFDNTGSPTLNTDLTVEVTCDGGAHWTAASLSTVTANSQGGRKVAETVDQATTGGTSFQARVKTLNNKSVPIYGISLTVH